MKDRVYNFLLLLIPTLGIPYVCLFVLLSRKEWDHNIIFGGISHYTLIVFLDFLPIFYPNTSFSSHSFHSSILPTFSQGSSSSPTSQALRFARAKLLSNQFFRDLIWPWRRALVGTSRRRRRNGRCGLVIFAVLTRRYGRRPWSII